jgi:hypothetical protein
MTNDLIGPKWRIGIYPGPPQIRMEEEEQPETRTWDSGRIERGVDEVAKHHIDQLLQQRASILNSMDIAKLSAEEKFKLLEETRLVMAQLNPARFKTEKVIYSILLFSGLVILVLAPLTALGKLPAEVTVTFIGTVVGGTIATIAQKLGKIGR